jgi:tetratricopeptide (TPR) repeat protein
MRYLCVHCDHRWEDTGSEPPRRCPGCMRATGVEAVRDAAEKVRGNSGGKSRRLIAAAVAVMLLGAGAGYWFTRGSKAHSSSALAPLDPDDLRAALLQDHVDAAGLEQLFVADAGMEALAKKTAGAESGAVARAEAVHRLLRARASALAFVPWSLGEPRGTPVMTARDTFSTVQKDRGRAQLYPLEVAALEAALLRALDVPAMLAELVEVPGERAPLDPAGYLGYFVVAVYDSEPGQGAPHLFDPYAGRPLASDSKVQVLSDTQVVGALLALRAVFEMAYHADPRAALESSSRAIQLAPILPSVRTARGVVVLGANMAEQGLQELTAARDQRPDAPRLHNLASAALMTGDKERAQRELTAALAKAPDFAAAHATLAAFDLLSDDADGARSELAIAERLAPDLSLVQWGMAEQLVRSGEREQGLARAEQAVKERPSFDGKLRFAVILRQAGKYDEMRKQAQELLAMSPSYRRGELRELLTQVLGPTAFDDVEPDPSAADLDDLGSVPPLAGGPDLKLQLGQGKLLGEPGGEAQGPGDPLILSGDQPKLRLHGSDEPKLKLKLDP